MFGGKPARGQPKPTVPPPPPPPRGVNFGASYVGSRQIEQPKRQNESPEWGALLGEGGGGKSTTFQIAQQWSNISRYLFHTIDVYSLPLPYCSVKVCLSPFSELWREKVCLIQWGGAYKRGAKKGGRSQSTTLHPTGNISAEASVYKNKVGHNSTGRTISSSLFFPLKLLLHRVYIFNIFMWTEVIDSRRL